MILMFGSDKFSGDLERAKKSYIEAISVDAVCAEALYNLGLVCKKLEQYPTALNWFEKLHAILRNNAEVIYQIADMYAILLLLL